MACRVVSRVSSGSRLGDGGSVLIVTRFLDGGDWRDLRMAVFAAFLGVRSLFLVDLDSTTIHGSIVEVSSTG